MTSGELKQRVAECTAALRHAGVKATHQRLAIFREAVSQGGHPDVEAVFTAVRRELPTISLDTVYRALHLFVDLGLLTTLGLSGERTRFDSNAPPHHHFVCRQCGATHDFHEPGFDVLSLPPEAQDLGQVERAYVELRGLCSRCAS